MLKKVFIISCFIGTVLANAQIMLPAYQAIQYVGPSLPTITTKPVTTFFNIQAGSGGDISNDGGDPVTVRGICWSTTPGPSTALTTKTTNGAGIGSFFSTMTNLTIGVTYYVRAYATNSIGTAYGNEIIYVAAYPNCGTVTTVTDIDGNTYQTVKVESYDADYCWMQSNLNVEHYTDGTPIPQVTDQTQWINLTTGAWCYYNNDPATGAVYGKLYNWYAVAGIYDTASLLDPTLRKKLAPIGWHIPDKNEWINLLRMYQGGVYSSAIRSRETGTIHWNTNYGTNLNGLTVLPGGQRRLSGTQYFISLRNNGNFWATTENFPTTYACYAFIGDYSDPDSGILKASGLSIRCKKD